MIAVITEKTYILQLILCIVITLIVCDLNCRLTVHMHFVLLISAYLQTLFYFLKCTFVLSLLPVEIIEIVATCIQGRLKNKILQFVGPVANYL